LIFPIASANWVVNLTTVPFNLVISVVLTVVTFDALFASDLSFLSSAACELMVARRFSPRAHFPF